MVNPKTKVAAASKQRVVKPASPKKSKQAPSMRKNLQNKKQKPVPLIRVLGFQDPLSIELYEYTLTENKPGFINNFRKWSRGELENDSLTETNFIGLKMQRDFALTGNEYLKYDDGYARYWMIRYPPQNVSTPETRSEGLRVLKSFFMSTQATNYPPGIIEISDMTTDIPAVLEKYFLDDDIEEILKASFDLEELEESFYERYTELAQTIYLEKEPSEYAQAILGFPSLT
jgi:hypothetical protein